MTDEAATPLTVPEVTDSATPTVMEPIRAGERVAVIDILRGLALFGIIAANIRGFSGPAVTYFEPQPMWPGFWDRLAQAVIDALIQGKFFAIFSFLFGVGFAVQLSRAEEKGAKFSGIYVRRLLGLLAIGLIHGLLIWWGDILLPYALTGFLLLIFRRRSTQTIAIWAGLLYLVPLLLITMASFLPLLTGEPLPSNVPTEDALNEIVAIYGEGSWLEIQTQRASDAISHNWAYVLVMIPQLLALFLFGVLAWRFQIFRPSSEWLPRYRLIMWIGLTVGLGGNVLSVILRWFSSTPLMPPSPEMYPVMLIQTIANPALSVGYVTLVIVVCQSDAWKRRLRGAGAIGRTALSNYLLQSILGTLLFYSYGLGWFGMGPAWLLVPTILIFAFEWWVSSWWISRFRFGPFEWAWRSVTYGRWQEFRKKGE